MAEREVKKWVTINGKHVPIYEDNNDVDASDYIDSYVINASSIGVGGALGEYRRYMKDSGFSDNVVEEARRLTSEHSGYHYEKADAQIVEALESGSELGRCLEATIEWEETYYKAWKAKNGEATVYRKGDRKDGVEPWTSNEEGADMGYGGIGWTHKSTVGELMNEGYRILGGIGRHLGSPGESEITFVKYKKREK